MGDQSDAIEEWIQSFHGTSYIINLIANEVLLVLEIEDEDTGERWSGEFTAQYIEEITHKAGNFKKFSLFVKMLSSAFSKTNDSVYIDVLTLSDLEMMKAKKLGTQTTSSATSLPASTASAKGQIQRKNLLKRYAILTYTGEFDRVHYPLPLAFEETPNVISLQRTIRRLRQTLKEKNSEELPPASERERELRQIVSQLRQENQELKHQMRQFSSRNGKFRSSSTSSPSLSLLSQDNSSPSAAPSEILFAQNLKLKKQVDDLKKQLSDVSLQCEKIKVDSAKEVAKWQHKLGQSPSKAGSPNLEKKNKEDSQLIAELKHRILLLEREVKLQRLSKGVPISRSSTPTSQASSQKNNGRNPDTNRRAMSARMSTRESAKKRSFSNSPASVTSNRSRTSARSGSPLVSTSTRAVQKPPKPNPNPSHANTSPWSYRSHSYDSEDNRLPSSRISAHYNPSSSSLGGRFDPTAYQSRRREQLLSTSQSPKRRGDRYSSPIDSGYSSANSQTSKQSRGSRISDFSSEPLKGSSKGKQQQKSTKQRKIAETVPVKRELFDDNDNEVLEKRKKKQLSVLEKANKGKASLIGEVSRRLELETKHPLAKNGDNSLEDHSFGRIQNENHVNYSTINSVKPVNSSLLKNRIASSSTGYQFEEKANLIRKSIDEDRLPLSRPAAKTVTVPGLSTKTKALTADFDAELEAITRSESNSELNQRIDALNAYLENARNGISALAKETSSVQSF